MSGSRRACGAVEGLCPQICKPASTGSLVWLGGTVDSRLDCLFESYRYCPLGVLSRFPLPVVPRKGKENAKTGVEGAWFAIKG